MRARGGSTDGPTLFPVLIMQRAFEVITRGHWRPEQASERIVLTFDQRWRRRLKLTAESGRDFLLDLEHAQVLRDGDALVLEGGELVTIVAAHEELLEVRARAQVSLARLAWHLGNRHTATAIEADRILVRRDHVLAEMLRGLDAEVREVMAPFDPEGGAYATGHAMAHHHDGHRHEHDHGHDHDH